MKSKLLVMLLLLFASASTYADVTATAISQSHMALTLASFFGIGILLAFTPCVLPMVPILSAILVGQKQKDTWHAFGLSLVFVLSMAATYAIAGILAGYAGSTIQTLMQTPLVIISFSLVFVVMALSMFGCFNLSMPAFLQNRANRMQDNLQQGSYAGVAIMGVLSTLIASPCITAPLLSVLTYISQTGNAGQGGLILFAMALGMGLPLILFGIGQSALLPKSGIWMEKVKKVFGVMILGLAIWMLSRILPGDVVMLLWSALLIVSAVAFGALDFHAEKRLPPFLHGVSVLALLYGVLLLTGAASGNSNLTSPLSPTFDGKVLSQRPPSALFGYASTMTDLQAKLAVAKNANKPALVEFFASWCPDCKKVDAEVLSDAEVRKSMKAFTAIRVDVSERNPELAKMMESYHIYGVPTMVFFDREGKQLKGDQVESDITKESLLKTLRQLAG